MVRGTGSRKLLTPFVDPKVGDPLGAGQHGTGRVTRHIVSLAVSVQVVPEGGRALLWPQRDAQSRKHRSAAQLHVGGVHQQRGNTIAGP